MRMWDKKRGEYVEVAPAFVEHPIVGRRYQKHQPHERAAEPNEEEAGTAPAGKESDTDGATAR